MVDALPDAATAEVVRILGARRTGCSRSNVVARVGVDGTRDDRRLRRSTSLVIIVLAVVLSACSAQTGPSPTPSAASPGPTGSPSAAQASPSPLASSDAGVSPRSSLSADATTALDLATRWETARAAGRWSEAWAVLSAQSQATIGSLATFEANERADNDVGGAVFTIQDPTRDTDLVASFLGADEAQSAKVSDASRGWLVFIQHPAVKGASAGSTGLYVAPLSSGEWRIWIVH
jgi:hypothetical protein